MKALACFLLLIFCHYSMAQEVNEFDWTSLGFRDVSIDHSSLEEEFYQKSKNTYDKAIDLHFFLPAGGSWSLEDLHVELVRAAQIYTQCNIKISQIWMVWAAHDKIGLNYVYNYDHDEERKNLSDLFDLISIKSRPVIFLADTLDYGTKGLSDKLGLANPKVMTTWLNARKSMIDTLFLFYKSSQPQDGTTLAHELAHLLGNVGHNDLKYNLLSTTTINNRVNTKLTKKQCKEFRKSDLLYSLSN